MGVDARKPDFVACGEQQRPDLRSMVSSFVKRSLESIIAKLSTYKVSLLELVSVAEQTDRKLVDSVSRYEDYFI